MKIDNLEPEDARLGLPLEDLFQWRRTHLLLPFGAGSIDELVASANPLDRELTDLCERLGLDLDAPPRAPLNYLEQQASPAMAALSEHKVVREAIAHLDGESS